MARACAESSGAIPRRSTPDQCDLQARNRLLEIEVLDLKTGLEAVEERARSELGMIGSDETFVLVIE